MGDGEGESDGEITLGGTRGSDDEGEADRGGSDVGAGEVEGDGIPGGEGPAETS